MDESKITKVSFPTWTDYNGQDDLIEPWKDNYTGKGSYLRNGKMAW